MKRWVRWVALVSAVLMEVPGGPNEAGRHGGERCRFGPALLFFLREFVTQALAVDEVLLEEQQHVVGNALEDRVALLCSEGAGPGFTLAHLAF